MDKILELLQRKCGNKFSFLKILETEYFTQKGEFVIVFLYPESINEISVQDKALIYDTLSNTLNLQAKLILKFHKSYLDEELIIEKTYTFFKNFYRSLASVVNKNSIKVNKQEFEIVINVGINKDVLENFNADKIKNDLKAYLERNFCGTFSANFTDGDAIDEEEINKKTQTALLTKIQNTHKTPRYKVIDFVKLAGKDIEPEPEYLMNIKSEKQNVILAGRVENLMVRQYKKKKGEKEIEKSYYKFNLREDTRYISSIYFCPKASTKKMQQLSEGDEVLVIANIEKDGNYLSAKITSIGLCQIPENARKLGIERPNHYIAVTPEKMQTFMQDNIFETNIKYNENITNNTFVVFDVETTGLDPETCEITEIGAVKIVNGIITEKFQTLVKIKGVVPPFISNLTKITNDMLATAPKISDVIKDFSLFSKDAILSGYNVGFDMRFIQKAGGEIGITFENPVQDVMSLAKGFLHSGKNISLDNLVKTLNINLTNAHRALYDATATAEALLRMSRV